VPAAAGEGLAEELRLLAQWLGTDSVTVGRALPRPWVRALRALG
jgi:hypothetical protein